MDVKASIRVWNEGKRDEYDGDETQDDYDITQDEVTEEEHSTEDEIDDNRGFSLTNGADVTLSSTPIRKMNELRLQSRDNSMEQSEEVIEDQATELEEETESEYLTEEEEEPPQEFDNLLDKLPVFINNKKRQLDSTPQFNRNVVNGELKDTPCPTQPRKKIKKNQLKFKNAVVRPSVARLVVRSDDSFSGDDTVIESSRSVSPVLNINNLSSMNYSTPINKTHDEDGNPHIYDKIHADLQHSTPINSRSSSPQFEEYGDNINGYKLLKEKNQPEPRTGKFTPQNPFVFNPNKRINDPYLKQETSIGPSRALNQSFESYLTSWQKYEESKNLNHIKLPLLDQNDELSNSNVLRFYESNFVSVAKDDYMEDLRNLLKKERIKWHPDKWMNRLEDSSATSVINLDRVKSVCQVISSILEDINE